MTTLSYTYPLTPGTAEDFNKVNQNLTDIKNTINGPAASGTGLDADNLKSASGITDAYKQIVPSLLVSGSGLVAATSYLLNELGASPASGTLTTFTGATAGLSVFYLNPADYTAGSKTSKLRVRVTLMVNATAPASTFTFDLYPVTGVAGAAGVHAVTGGSSTAIGAFTTPTASSLNVVTMSDVAFPSAGYYVVAMNSSATMAANSFIAARAIVQHLAV